MLDVATFRKASGSFSKMVLFLFYTAAERVMALPEL